MQTAKSSNSETVLFGNKEGLGTLSETLEKFTQILGSNSTLAFREDRDNPETSTRRQRKNLAI